MKFKIGKPDINQKEVLLKAYYVYNNQIFKEEIIRAFVSKKNFKKENFADKMDFNWQKTKMDVASIYSDIVIFAALYNDENQIEAFSRMRLIEEDGKIVLHIGEIIPFDNNYALVQELFNQIMMAFQNKIDSVSIEIPNDFLPMAEFISKNSFQKNGKYNDQCTTEFTKIYSKDLTRNQENGCNFSR
jgi:hypothetical protein